MYRIVADSSCDMNTNEELNLVSVPLLLYTDEREYIDDENIDIHELVEYMEQYKGRSYTACPGSESWADAYRGYDEVYVVTITSGLSGTYNSALAAKDMYLEENPNAKVHVFDSLSTGPEMRMAIEKINELKSQGASFEEVCEKVQKYLDSSKLLFVLSSVHNLAQNGRVNKVIASAVGMLGISIIGIANEEGQIKQIGKARGDKKVISSLLSKLKEYGYNGEKIRICHIENEKLAEKISEAIKAIYEKAEILFYPAGGLCSYYAERGGVLLGFEV